MKILIVDTMHPSIFNMFEQHGWSYDYLPKLKRDEIMARLDGYDGLVIRSKTKVDEAFLSSTQTLKFIARAGAGLDLIDLAAVGKRQLQLFHAGEGNRDAVGEQALGMILALFNNLLRADRQVRQGVWDREGNRGVELLHKTVGIIGYGNNGRATAKRFSGFGCEVLAYDRYLTNYGDEYAQEASLEELQRRCDVISFHVPLTGETRFWFNDSFISSFSKPFYLMNLSRGEVVSLPALVRALESGKVRGACLDVLENEKLHTLTEQQQGAFDYLKTSDRVVLSPHIGGWTHESYVRINEVLVRQIAEKF
ncbi:D-3-phosphoglycerate dehydrogenase [Dyadobacter jejuensis]|uniref:D-3-phosphoglycerate dehydrogenase n=1 Tax=Dyadobacter jejuensis TaxID=1082580 RepID=A0A316B8G0_9BACT|nr:2-hydroxyacid dehydrogenase [Dyadobacter jejuensis]PWJ58867.1 D-3-phosphoglycerate dehydrogenase [Dyadobacter jejuensis]